MSESFNRRELKSRKAPIFTHAAIALVKMGITPNQVSVSSAAFAALGGFSIYYASQMQTTAMIVAYLLLGFFGVQMRLLCNLIDGLMAIEGGKKTAGGEFYNDFPDRVSDIIFLLCAGYAINVAYGPLLGWACAMLAVLTAYIRVLGVSMGSPAYFIGPMAKQHRMAILNLGLVASIIEAVLTGKFYWGLLIALCIMLPLMLVTCIRRIQHIFAFLEKK